MAFSLEVQSQPGRGQYRKYETRAFSPELAVLAMVLCCGKMSSRQRWKEAGC